MLNECYTWVNVSCINDQGEWDAPVMQNNQFYRVLLFLKKHLNKSPSQEVIWKT